MKIICLILALVVLGSVPVQGGYSKRILSTADLINYLQPHLDPEIAALHARYIDKFATHWKVDRLKVISITHLESRFRADALSRVGCIGAMQVNPRAHRDKLKRRGITYRELFLLKNNYDVGSEILRDCLRSSRSFDEALYKYSGGSQNYPTKVKKIYGMLSS